MVRDAAIVSASNTVSNGANFAVLTQGGTGPCVGQWITFPESDASDTNAHQRAYSTALMALSTGMNVSIFNYYSTTCDRASFIEIKK